MNLCWSLELPEEPGSRANAREFPQGGFLDVDRLPWVTWHKEDELECRPQQLQSF